MKLPSDHSERRRFAEEIERNFSVVAAAGSGKTYAITERIVQIALSPKAEEILPRLVVVTFTHRAADEMQQRTRHRILQESATAGNSHRLQPRFLRHHPQLLHEVADAITDITSACRRRSISSPTMKSCGKNSCKQHLHTGRNLSDENRAALFRLAQARQLMELGRNARSVLAPSDEIGQCPVPSFSEVLAVSQVAPPSGRSLIHKRNWQSSERRFRDGWDFVRWPRAQQQRPKISQLRGAKLLRRCAQWVTDSAMCVAAEVQRDYRDFRLMRGVLTYADQVALADELMQHPIAGAACREENFRVILDEAQDTDPAQFSVLTEIARPPEAHGRWLETQTDPPRPGHFCMVGDFQQSIYHDRADLQNYETFMKHSLGDDDADELKFSVTFRLDKKQLKFINRNIS